LRSRSGRLKIGADRADLIASLLPSPPIPAGYRRPLASYLFYGEALLGAPPGSF